MIVLQKHTAWKCKRRLHVTVQRRITQVKLGRQTQATSTDCLPAGVNQWRVNMSPALLLASCSAAYTMQCFLLFKKNTSKLNGLVLFKNTAVFFILIHLMPSRWDWDTQLTCSGSLKSTITSSCCCFFKHKILLNVRPARLFFATSFSSLMLCKSNW